MADWSAWFDEVLPQVPGCPQNVATNAIRNAAVEFCERTRVYVVDHPAISAVANTPTYSWAPGTGLKVIRAEQVWYDGEPLVPVTRADLEDRFKDWTAETGTPRYFLQEALDVLRVVPIPTEALADGITAKVSVAPSRASTTIADSLWERYLDAIACGALARLMSMSGVPYANPEMAAKHERDFDDAVGRVNLRAFRGHTRARNNSTLGRRRFL